MTDVVVDRLRIRGPEARRLTVLAATLLPAALDEAFADIEDVHLDALRVDLDLADHDDETLVVLWASQIRRAALEAGARRRRPGAAPRTGGTSGPRHGLDVPRDVATAAGGQHTGRPWQVDPAELAALALAWLQAGAPRSSVPRSLARLADPVVAQAVTERLGAGVAARLARSVAEVGTAEGHDQGPEVPSGRREPGSSESQPGTVGQDGLAARGEAGPGAPLARRLAAAAAELGRLLDLADADPRAGTDAADLQRVTRVAGLVILYPWLAELCEEAVRWHPLHDPVDVRRAALAAVVDAEDPDLVDDPLVLLLAGAQEATPMWTPAPATALPHGDVVTSAAEAVLTRFCALLPGFEASSAAFVRTSWVRRDGVLDGSGDGGDPVRLVAETLPLDVMLRLLPYPLSLLRLPWSVPLIVRFAP